MADLFGYKFYRPALWLLMLLAMMQHACQSTQYHESQMQYERIVTGPGPEDMTLDTSHTPRFIISCSQRRKDSLPHQEIWQLDLQTQQSSILPRQGHPDSILFSPHGLDMGYHNGLPYLLVVNHEEKINRHTILRYHIWPDRLIYDTVFVSSLIRSPNDVSTGHYPAFWVTNDASSRHSALETLLKIKGGNVVYYDGRVFRKAIPRLAYPNSVMMADSLLFVSTTRQNRLFVYTKKSDGPVNPASRKMIAKAPGWDNISRVTDSTFLCTAHVNPTRFYKHYKNSKNQSPIAVYQCNILTLDCNCLFYTDGRAISAGSTAWIYQDQLYICQVFDSFILKVSLQR